MPDNVTAPAAGAAFATDDIGGVHWPFTKLAFGPRDTANEVDDAAGKRLPVQIGGTLPAFASTPTFNIGTAPTLPVTGPLTDAQLRATALPVSGPLTDSQLRAAAVPISAASLPLPTGAATAAAQTTGNNSLASIDGKLAALEGGRAAVTLAPIDRPIAEPTFAGRRVAVGAAASGDTLPTLGASRRIRVLASTRCFLRTGTVTNNAGTDGNSLAIAADAETSFIVPAGHTSFSVVRDSADGFISIMPWAG